MSDLVGFALVGLVLALVVLRQSVPGLPPRAARTLAPVDLAVLLLGVLGLVVHCTSMFFGFLLTWIVPIRPFLQLVNALGAGSQVAYAVPAVLVLVALRRQHWWALAGVFLTLLAVGVTMYDGSPLRLHVGTIVAATAAIASVGTLLTRGRRLEPTPSTEATG